MSSRGAAFCLFKIENVIFLCQARPVVYSELKMSFSCLSQARPAPSSVVWSRAEEPEFKQLGRFLTLKNVTHDQAGVYTCTVTNVVRYSDYSCLLKYTNM